MQIKRTDIDNAVKEKLITAEQASHLWLFWTTKKENTPHFCFLHGMYYFGGLLAIAAITLFVTQAWDAWRGMQFFLLSALLFLSGILLWCHFLKKKLLIPAGIMSTFNLALIPLLIYNLQIWLKFLPPQPLGYTDFHNVISWYWVPMEVSTLGAGMIMFYFSRFPLLIFLMAIVLWYMSMDLFSLLFHFYGYSERITFSICFGLIIIFLSLYVDFKYENPDKDYAYWLYLCGVIIFWGGFSLQSKSEWVNLFYGLINFIMILTGIFLNRRVFAIFGAFGIFAYLLHLSFSVFSKSIGFPIALLCLGIAILFIATRWPSVEKKLFRFFRPYIPQTILKKRGD